jgi:undecaprenyl-diphosphatase
MMSRMAHRSVSQTAPPAATPTQTPQRAENATAIAALGSAFVFPPLGIALGHWAIGQIRRSREEGRTLALAALVVGYLLTAIGAAAIVWLSIRGVIDWAPSDMSWLQVVVLAVLQGLTEFLPVSSSGHLAIASRVFFADDAGASFTAVIQIGTELAVLLYFARDIGRILKAWFIGLFAKAHRGLDYWMGWYVIIGTIPIGLLGLLFKDEIRTSARNLWVVATALVAFSAVIAAAEYFGRQTRHAEQLNWRDSVTVGLAQCLALVPGVSRSGATISAGLFLGLDRELAARFGFLLAIPAVFASGLFSLPDAFHPVSEGMSASGPQLLVATEIAFVIGYLAVAWFLRFLVNHSMYWFVGYRVVVGVAVMVLLGTGVVAAA